MKLSITIRGLPKMLNGGHGSWKANASLKRKWKMKMAQELIGLGPQIPYQKIKVTFTRCSSSEPDDDNLAAGFKPIRDALVKFGFVVDDKRANMETHYRWEPSPRGEGYVKIEMESLDEGRD